MNMPGRKFSAGTSYRYGFNGKENDKDISEGGQDYGMRIYDARVGRFLSEDPITKKYPELTPYQFASNRPIDGIDLDGLEWYKADDAVVSIYLTYSPSKKSITTASTYFIPQNIPYALKETIHHINKQNCDNCVRLADDPESIKYETMQVGNISQAKPADQPEMKDVIDMPTAAQPQNHSTQIIPKNKKEAREQEKSGKFWTPNNPTGNAKATLALAIIESIGTIGKYFLDDHVKGVINKAVGQSNSGVIGVLNVMQNEINKGSKSLIPSKYLNENSLNQMANYLLYGKKIENSDFTGIDLELKSIADKLLPAVEAAAQKSRPPKQIPQTHRDNTNVIKTN